MEFADRLNGCNVPEGLEIDIEREVACPKLRASKWGQELRCQSVSLETVCYLMMLIGGWCSRTSSGWWHDGGM